MKKIGYENTAWDVSSQKISEKKEPVIKTPPKKAHKELIDSSLDRIPSGIEGLDELIEGGFKRGSTILVAGRAGSGKTVMAISFLIEGIKNGESVMYLTFEENKKQLYDDMKVFGWDLAKHEEEGKFVFLQYTPEQVKKVLTEGGGIIEAIITKSKISRMVIDSITSFTLLYQDELSKKQAALSLFSLIETWECTALLTSQDAHDKEDNVTATLEFEVSGIIFVYNIRKGAVRKRAMEIFKMRGTKHPNNTFAFDLTDDGVILHPKENVSID